jgi:hypothetical protein
MQPCHSMQYTRYVVLHLRLYRSDQENTVVRNAVDPRPLLAIIATNGLARGPCDAGAANDGRFSQRTDLVIDKTSRVKAFLQGLTET